MHRRIPLATSALGPVGLALLIACGSTTAPDRPQINKLYGINFSPYLPGQDPNLGAKVSEEQLRSRLAIIAPYVEWIRTFGSTNGLEAAGRIAHELGLKTAIGAWLGRDPSANEQEIANLVAAARAGEVDVAVVGNEVLLRGDLTAQELIAYIRRVRDAIPGAIPVTTAETCDVLLFNPEVVGEVDVVFANHYPYWAGVPLDGALDTLRVCHERLVAAAGARQVVVSETGWPSCGDAVGDAEPGPEAAATYLRQFVSWARANGVPFFYFEAFDEAWKARYEGPQGACWGLWDADGKLKPGMEDAFTTEIPDNDRSLQGGTRRVRSGRHAGTALRRVDRGPRMGGPTAVPASHGDELAIERRFFYDASGQALANPGSGSGPRAHPSTDRG